MFGLCSSRLWSILYQLYMGEFPHSDVLKIIQTFLCWNWNINISATGCLLKGWSGTPLLLCCSFSLLKWESHSVSPYPRSRDFLTFTWLLLSDQLGWFTVASALLLLFLFDFFFLNVHFQFPWRRKSGSRARNNKPWFIYRAAYLR